MTPDGSTITPEPAEAPPCRGIPGIEGICLKNSWNPGLLNKSPKGAPLKPKGISSPFSPAPGLCADIFGGFGVLVIITTDGKTSVAALWKAFDMDLARLVAAPLFSMAAAGPLVAALVADGLGAAYQAVAAASRLAYNDTALPAIATMPRMANSPIAATQVLVRNQTHLLLIALLLYSWTDLMERENRPPAAPRTDPVEPAPLAIVATRRRHLTAAFRPSADCRKSSRGSPFSRTKPLRPA